MDFAFWEFSEVQMLYHGGVLQGQGDNNAGGGG
jgi:hypothetical protein